MACFELLLPEYQAAPEVTRKRLYLDAMQQVMTDTNKVLIDAKNNGNLMYLPLDKLMKEKPVTTPEVEHKVQQNVNLFIYVNDSHWRSLQRTPSRGGPCSPGEGVIHG